VTTFALLAALMTIVALALVAWPLLRRGAGDERRAAWSASLVVVALPLLAVLLYAQWSNWPWRSGPATAQAPPEVTAMVERLAARLAKEGGSLEEWQMLGRSRVQLGEYDEAAEAYRQAYRMSGGADIETLTSYAEALVLADSNALRADAGDLFERALALSPQDPKALWYGGLAAFGRADYALARDRWQALLERDPPPPDEVKRILADRVAAAEAKLAEGASGPAQAASAATSPAPLEAPSSPASGEGSARTPRTIVVEVSVAPALAPQVNAAAPLFVLARSPGGGGPPLAVQRRSAGELPLTIELSDADAMVPGRGLSSAAAVEVVARVSMSGQPLAQSGDLYGSVQVAPGGGETRTRIEIDRVQP
jgi:cytochrome c-type biogenesis protein CcmH